MKESEAFSLSLEPQLGDKVRIKCSGETGMVIGYAVYLSAERQLLMRYRDGTGRAVEAWWDLSALEKV